MDENARQDNDRHNRRQGNEQPFENENKHWNPFVSEGCPGLQRRAPYMTHKVSLSLFISAA
ncbi:hypothetical protein RvVAR031_39960 [Agrobacterium vitis]|nr:hypothetical protein RvVAR031_39960 [Agrobacterium vitis]